MIDSSNDDLTDEALGIAPIDDLDAFPFAAGLFTPDLTGDKIAPKEIAAGLGKAANEEEESAPAV